MYCKVSAVVLVEILHILMQSQSTASTGVAPARLHYIESIKCVWHRPTRSFVTEDFTEKLRVSLCNEFSRKHSSIHWQPQITYIKCSSGLGAKNRPGHLSPRSAHSDYMKKGAAVN